MLSVEETLVLAIQMIAAIASLCTMVATFLFRQNIEARYYRIMSGLMAAWAILYGLEIVSPDLSSKVLIMQIRFAVVPFVGVFAVLIAAQHFGRNILLKARWKVAISIIPAITSILALTSNYHHLFRYDFSIRFVGSLTVLDFHIGPWYIVYMASAYILTIISTIIAIHAVLGSNKVFAKQGVIFVVAFVSPLFPDLVYQFGASPIQGFNFSSATFTLSALLIFWSIFRLQMFSIKPVVRAEVVEHLPDPVLLLDENDILVDYNPAASAVFGWDGPTLIGRKLSGVIPEVMPLLTLGEVRTAAPELALTTRGRRFVFEVNTTNVMLNGKVKERIVILRDITLRRYALDALRDSERKYRELIDMAPFPVVITDMDTRTVMFINEKAEKVFEVPREKAKGEKVEEYYINPDDRTKMMTEIQEKGMSTDNEVKMRTASGKVFWAYISAVATTFDGRSAMFSAFNDISERKRMEDALRVTNSKLMLLSSISRHDLMNQLVALSGYLRQAEGSREEATIKATYRKMEANLASVQHMMEFMKDYQELGVTAPGWFGICDLIDAARSKLSLDKISVACDLNGAQVYGDALLEKVFYNLFDNTLRHGVKVTTVTIQLEERLGGNAIIYQDDGVGVAAEDKERIFQRGFGKNSGLGLFLSREILGITGMSIQENGDPGKGARFEIFVPSSVFRSGNA